MSRPDYSALDAAILAFLDNGPSPAMRIEWNVQSWLVAHTGPHASGYPDRPLYRTLDARLQALRKAGKIKCIKRLWMNPSTWYTGPSEK